MYVFICFLIYLFLLLIHQIANRTCSYLKYRDRLDMCVLERACWCRCRVLLEGAAVRVACALSSLVCWCRCTVEGAAVRVALEVACWCRWRMLLQGVAVLELVPLQGAVEGCCFRVLSEQRVRFGAGLCCCRVPLQGAAVRVRVRFGGLLVPLCC